jgi:hypothetical protein
MNAEPEQRITTRDSRPGHTHTPTHAHTRHTPTRHTHTHTSHCSHFPAASDHSVTPPTPLPLLAIGHSLLAAFIPPRVSARSERLAERSYSLLAVGYWLSLTPTPGASILCQLPPRRVFLLPRSLAPLLPVFQKFNCATVEATFPNRINCLRRKIPQIHSFCVAAI